MRKTKRPTPYIVMLVLVVLLSFLCSMLCFQLLLIQGDSMLPTFSSGRLCVTNKMDRDYQKGDCILFYCPALEQNLVKRIVALPGDTLQISEGKLLISGIVTELYPSSHSISDAGLASAPITVPEDCCFVLGVTSPAASTVITKKWAWWRKVL